MKLAKRKNWLLLVPLVAVVALNLGWEHQTLLGPMVDISGYYHFAAREPFLYRMLPALLYYALMGGPRELLTSLNAPFNSSACIFQLLLDAASLAVTLIFLDKIVRRLNPLLRPSFTLTVAAAAEILVVVFGYFMVPNRAFFYPYDFPDLCFVTVIFYLCIRLEGRAEYLLAAAIFVASLNKETALFYSGLYVAFRATLKADWGRELRVLALCGVASLAARGTVIWLARQLNSGAPTINQQYEYHLHYTLQQMSNPLFVFAMLNICSYLYLAIYLLRRRLDRTDVLILIMITFWTVIMSTVGIIRELRIFVPATIMMFVIIARHLTAVVEAWSPMMGRRGGVPIT